LIQGELYVTLSFTGPAAWERPLPTALAPEGGASPALADTLPGYDIT
jgi:hypothetical protein